ncbi:aspartate 1-decarboxylase [Acetobacterium bakii]|uniref:Aspartate 1-decarboxylase n=1 Tax=Acetobacterium bakii TaxID=52689 RepID=A0A0L6TZ35_9FIRM|nr:aspartate 1-decarboxylase [Acetobacterium bakii]KNZ41513.1 L-aspartate 1-decarboxylase [Acetobacterium bakii]
MYITLFKSKLHRGTITEANINYVGSITIDCELLEKSDILPGERVQVVNVNNGERFETYTIEGERGTGIICVNGAAARLVQIGDQVIIISYAMMEKKEAPRFKPKVLILDDGNKILKIKDKEEHGHIE